MLDLAMQNFEAPAYKAELGRATLKSSQLFRIMDNDEMADQALQEVVELRKAVNKDGGFIVTEELLEADFTKLIPYHHR